MKWDSLPFVGATVTTWDPRQGDRDQILELTDRLHGSISSISAFFRFAVRRSSTCGQMHQRRQKDGGKAKIRHEGASASRVHSRKSLHSDAAKKFVASISAKVSKDGRLNAYRRSLFTPFAVATVGRFRTNAASGQLVFALSTNKHQTSHCLPAQQN